VSFPPCPRRPGEARRVRLAPVAEAERNESPTRRPTPIRALFESHLTVHDLRRSVDFYAEPSVLAWMPAAAVYFRDPDGHLLEYLAMLDDEPMASAGIIPYSRWVAARRR
jgi:hypothetical protein